MIKKFWTLFPHSRSDNPKSKSGPADQNPKWAWLVALGVALALCGAAVVEAQQQAKIIKIGWLASGRGRSAQFESTKQALRALGYIEGKNIAFEFRFPEEGKPDQLPALAEELVRLKVDMIVAIGGLPP